MKITLKRNKLLIASQSVPMQINLTSKTYPNFKNLIEISITNKQKRKCGKENENEKHDLFARVWP